MLLLPVVAPLRNSGVSLTVATGDLARVAIMSGVMRSTVCPFASVVMDEGGRRRTSLPWMRRFVAVIGIPVPPGLFIPNWPVMDTFNKSSTLTSQHSHRHLANYPAGGLKKGLKQVVYLFDIWAGHTLQHSRRSRAVTGTPR